jgi:hypothetical protein
MADPIQHLEHKLATYAAHPRSLEIDAIASGCVPIVDETGREVGHGAVVDGRIIATVTDAQLAARLRRAESGISIGYRIEAKAIPATPAEPHHEVAAPSDAERERVASIRDIARRAKLGDAWANKLIEAGTSVAAARCTLLDAAATER